MPLGIFPLLLGLAILVTLASAYYLLINARALAAMFASPDNEIAPGPGHSPPPRGRIIAAAMLFTSGILLSLLTWSLSGTDTAANAVASHPGEVQRP